MLHIVDYDNVLDFLVSDVGIVAVWWRGGQFSDKFALVGRGWACLSHCDQCLFGP